LLNRATCEPIERPRIGSALAPSVIVITALITRAIDNENRVIRNADAISRALSIFSPFYPSQSIAAVVPVVNFAWRVLIISRVLRAVERRTDLLMNTQGVYSLSDSAPALAEVHPYLTD
jgi:hypothetical protein